MRLSLFPIVVGVVFIFLLAGPISTAYATVIFSDGFESGNFSAWTGVKDQSPAVVSYTACCGSYTAFCNVTGICVCYKEVTPTNHLFIRAYYKFGAMPTDWTNRGLGYFVEDNMIEIVSMFEIAHFTGSNYVWKIEALNGTALQIVDSSIFSLDVSHWYCIELEMLIDGSDGYTKLYVDNALAASLEGVDNDFYGPIGRAGAGSVWENTNNEPVWWDCCVVADNYIGLETSIPETQTFFFLPILVVTILLVALILRRKQNTKTSEPNSTPIPPSTKERIHV